MMLVRRITTTDALLLRDIRLRALQRDPLSFGSTYDREAPRDLAAWKTWARDHSVGDDKATFLALRGAEPVGLVAGVRTEHSCRFGLFSMWVDGAEVRRGIGRALVEAVVGWVVASRGTHLSLLVTQDGARTFYERCGFVDDGRHEWLAHSPHVIEVGMTRDLG
jgi:GNAT superfamily N-acetyltransferase